MFSFLPEKNPPCFLMNEGKESFGSRIYRSRGFKKRFTNNLYRVKTTGIKDFCQ
jgi:hypothetical protein